MTRRVVAVFTGNRAEFGLQYPILRAIDRHPDLDYRLLVAGAHLDEDFGRTQEEIVESGFHVDATIAMEVVDDTVLSTARAIGSGVSSVAEVLHELSPDLFVVYADRFEGFAAMIAGTQTNVLTAHVEGGDVTEGGALDDSVRHAMTKLAHLHFATNAQAAARIRAMGEEPWRVHDVGFPAIDLIQDGDFAAAEEVTDRFGLDLQLPLVVFTQHSVTTQADRATEQIRPSLEALERLARDGVQVLMTYPNNDAGGRRIAAELERFAARDLPRVQLHKSVGRSAYHGLLHLCGHVLRGACVGNSSSGIKETPAFACPTVDIGTRQEGRLAAENVLHVGYDAEGIEDAVRRCLFDDTFRELAAICPNPYGTGEAGDKIAHVLSTIELDDRLLVKKMTIDGSGRVAAGSA